MDQATSILKLTLILILATRLESFMTAFFMVAIFPETDRHKHLENYSKLPVW